MVTSCNSAPCADRVHVQKSQCTRISYTTSADVVSGTSMVYHRNTNTSYRRATLAGENIPFDASTMGSDPLADRTTGGKMLLATDSKTVVVAMLTANSPTAQAYEAALNSLATASAPHPPPTHTPLCAPHATNFTLVLLCRQVCSMCVCVCVGGGGG